MEEDKDREEKKEVEEAGPEPDANLAVPSIGAGRGVVAFLNKIKSQDLTKIREIVDVLHDRLEDGSVSTSSSSSSSSLRRRQEDEEEESQFEHDARFLVKVSRMVSEVSYKKGSVKDRFRDIPWHNLEYLFILLERALSVMKRDASAEKKQKQEEEEEQLLVSLCAIAVPLVMKEDMPELHDRLSSLLRHQEEEMEVFGGSINEESVLRTVVTAPPATGLVHLVKLTYHFMDEMQLQSLLDHMRPLLETRYTGSRLQKYALMRLLTIIGESTKYMSPYLKGVDGTIPWKNIEKVRDLLGHVSRVPIREAVQSLLEGRMIRGANLAEDDQVKNAGETNSVRSDPLGTAEEAKAQTAGWNDEADNCEDNEEPNFSRKVIQLPPNLLRDVYDKDLVVLGKKFTALQEHHESLHFEYVTSAALSVALLSAAVFALLLLALGDTASPSTPFSSFRAIVIGMILLLVTAYVYVAMMASTGAQSDLCRLLPSTLVRRRGKTAGTIWRALPEPAAYTPQSLALRRYSKLKEREIEEKRRREELERKQAESGNDVDDAETAELVRELIHAILAVKKLEDEETSEKERQEDQASQTVEASEEQAAVLSEKERAKVEHYRRALRREATLDKDQTKALWLLITDKAAKKRWAERLWGKARTVKRVKTKTSEDDGTAKPAILTQDVINRRKLARKLQLIELHQNSTLNKEGKLSTRGGSGEGAHLKKFVLLRKFLQNPTDTKEDQSMLCVKFIVSTLRQVEQLLWDEMPEFIRAFQTAEGLEASSPPSDEAHHVVDPTVMKSATERIREHPLLQYALQFQIGLYALYAAQVKWWYSHLLGVEHVTMRDSVMHGTGHSYSHHLTDAGIADMLGHIALMLRIRPSLETALHQLRVQTAAAAATTPTHRGGDGDGPDEPDVARIDMTT